jgi:acyl carrier protein
VTHVGTITARTPSRQANAFAAAYFNDCEAHAREARAVYEAVMRLRRDTMEKLDADAAVEVVLGASPGFLPGADSLDVVEQLMAIEEEIGPQTFDAEREPARSLISDAVFRVLLGPASARSQWNSATIWVRSIRGVINERVRWEGGCTCAQSSDRPPTR